MILVVFICVQSKSPFFSLIVVPAKELANQVASVIASVTKYCPAELVKCCNISGVESFQIQKNMIAEQPAILISTPSRIIPHLESKSLILKDSLEMLIIDEADLIVSFGYQDDLNRIMSFLPNFCQTILISATLTEEIERLQKLLLKSPVSIKLDEEDERDVLLADGSEGTASARLEQFSIKCESEKEKFLLLFVIFKLRLVRGKSLIFVNEINSSYRVKLFLEKFGISSCLLNPELPLNSRYHIVEEFNRGIYDIVIASDTCRSDADAVKSLNGNKNKTANVHADPEFSVSRGIDFKEVDCVFNFDVPLTHQMYQHRVGRTARAGNKGTAYTFHTKKEETLIESLIESEAQKSRVIKPFTISSAQVQSFEYRVEDVFRSITKTVIHEARLKEIKTELLNSSKLKAHFSAKPQDLMALRHDRPMHPSQVLPHLRHVPDYLLKSVNNIEEMSHPSKRNLEQSVQSTASDSILASASLNPSKKHYHSSKKERNSSSSHNTSLKKISLVK